MTIVVSSSSKEIMANPARLIEAMRAGDYWEYRIDTDELRRRLTPI